MAPRNTLTPRVLPLAAILLVVMSTSLACSPAPTQLTTTLSPATASPIAPASAAPTDLVPHPSPTPLPGGITADCDGVPQDLCEKTAAVALAWKFALEPDQRLVGWHARPTEVTCAEPDEAKVDVTLDFVNPVAKVVLTIAALPDGRLEVCTF